MGCYNTAVINAPIDQVWAAMSNFHDMSWAKGVVEELEVIGEKSANQIGAKRLLNGAIHETLVSLNDVDRSFAYQITDGPGPFEDGKVGGFIGSVRLFPVTASEETFVEWSSRWESSEGGVAEFCNPIYEALLSALATHFETPKAMAAGAN